MYIVLADVCVVQYNCSAITNRSLSDIKTRLKYLTESLRVRRNETVVRFLRKNISDAKHIISFGMGQSFWLIKTFWVYRHPLNRKYVVTNVNNKLMKVQLDTLSLVVTLTSITFCDLLSYAAVCPVLPVQYKFFYILLIRIAFMNAIFYGPYWLIKSD